MEGNTQTPLAYIMDLLGVSGTKLANAIHIHQSMVSRWKIGSVEFTASTRYFEDVVNALIVFDKEQHRGTLQSFLSSIYGGPMQRQDDVYKHLVMWLTGVNYNQHLLAASNNAGSSFYVGNHKVFKGIYGRKKAERYFLETLLALPGVQDVWFLKTDLDRNDVKSFVNQISNLQEKQLNVNVILPLNDSRDEIWNILTYWMTVSASARLQIYYTYNPDTTFFERIYYVKDKLLLIGSKSAAAPGEKYTSIYDDPFTVAQMDSYIQSVQNHFKPLLRHYEGAEIYDDPKDPKMAPLVKSDHLQYLFLQDYFLSAFPGAEVIPDALDISDADKLALGKLIKRGIELTQLILQNRQKTRIILSSQFIQALGKQQDVPINIWSHCLQRPISVPSHFIVQQLRALLDAAENDPLLELAIQPADSEPFAANISLWVKESSFIYSCPINNYETRSFTKEVSSVYAFTMQADIYWRCLPYECKTIEFIRRQLDAEIDSPTI